MKNEGIVEVPFVVQATTDGITREGDAGAVGKVGADFTAAFLAGLLVSGHGYLLWVTVFLEGFAEMVDGVGDLLVFLKSQLVGVIEVIPSSGVHASDLGIVDQEEFVEVEDREVERCDRVANLGKTGHDTRRQPTDKKPREASDDGGTGELF